MTAADPGFEGGFSVRPGDGTGKGCEVGRREPPSMPVWRREQRFLARGVVVVESAMRLFFSEEALRREKVQNAKGLEQSPGGALGSFCPDFVDIC